MELSVSGRLSSPLNTILFDGEGRALYKISSPSFTRKSTTIFRISAEAATTYQGQLAQGNKDKGYLDVGLEEIARIHWHLISSTRIIFNGQILEVKDFMPKHNASGLKRTFLGPDGQSYSWKTEPYSCRLVRGDDTNQAKDIAIMHAQTIHKGSRARLEIDPAGLPILDLIVTTWVYYETRRRMDFGQPLE